MLIWDINCSDPRFVTEGEPIFKDLERLALYYCWMCHGEITYRAVRHNQFHIFQNIGNEPSPDFPYENYPLEFNRCPIELSRPSEMPNEIRRLFVEDFKEPLDDKAKKELSYWLGHPSGEDEFDIWWQQFGGEPWLVQGDETIGCPNPACSAAKRGLNMRILASVSNDPPSGLPMIEVVNNSRLVYNRWVQLVFHVCDECFTIHACNRCD
jgi:hypothetical protein